MARPIQTLLFKRGTKAVLEATLVGDKKPQAGEPIYETDTGKMKIGDGVSNYAALNYIGGNSMTGQLVFGNHYEFPTTGSINTLYVATDEGCTYYWDASSSTNPHYVAMAAKEIDGGGADTVYR